MLAKQTKGGAAADIAAAIGETTTIDASTTVGEAGQWRMVRGDRGEREGGQRRGRAGDKRNGTDVMAER